MPNYPGSSQAQLLYENQQYFLWQNETPATNDASRAVQLRRNRGASIPFGYSIEILFSGDPGTFGIDIQEADTDVATHYVTMNSVSSVNSTYAARVDLPITWTKYVRVALTALTNAVTVTAMVSR